MIHAEEQLVVQMGAAAEELKKHEHWPKFEQAIRNYIAVRTPSALRRGNTDFEKGELAGMSLVLAILDDNIALRKEVLARHQAELEEEEASQ